MKWVLIKAVLAELFQPVLVTVSDMHLACTKLTSTEVRKERKKEWTKEYGAKAIVIHKRFMNIYKHLLKENYYSVGRSRNQHHTLQNVRIKICFYKYRLTSYVKTGSQMNTTVTETKASLSILFHLLIYFSIQPNKSTNVFKTLNTWLVNPWLYLIRS